MDKSKKIAFTGVIAAMSITILLMTSVFPFATYALPGLAGVLFAFLVIEVGMKWAFACYISTSILALFLVPNKESTAIFIFLLGYFPIVKAIIEGKFPKFLGYSIKLLLFNCSMIIAYSIMLFLVKSPLLAQEFGTLTSGFLWGLLGMGNVTFLMYDFALTQLISVYILKYRKKIIRK